MKKSLRIRENAQRQNKRRDKIKIQGGATMITKRKRAIAMLLSIVLTISGLYVMQGNRADAAGAGGTMTITTDKCGLSLPGSGYGAQTGYVNLAYTKTVTDYKAPGVDFLTADFAERYITYGGGMTYEDLVEGKLIFYVATESILQLNWSQRSTPFTPGWSFTIAQGAPLPYTTTSGGTGYMTLDKEYTFSFEGSNAEENQHVLTIKGIHTTTFSLAASSNPFGNGKAENATTEFGFDSTDTNVSGYDTKYTRFETEGAYAPYFALGNYEFSELESAGIKIRTVLDGSSRCIQIEQWGNLRETMKAGDQVIFKKGFPLYYTASGEEWRADLDATYVYECIGSNEANSQVFRGIKLDESAYSYGIATGTNTIKPFSQNEGRAYNLSMTPNTNTDTTYVGSDVMTDRIADEYIKVADLTRKEAVGKGIELRYIPTANVLQLQLSQAAIEYLKAGDTIELKKGMPTVYEINQSLKAAVLDDDYTITITENDKTDPLITVVKSGSFQLKSGKYTKADEAEAYYWDLNFEGTLFADAKAEFQGDFTGLYKTADLLNNYFAVSGKSGDDLTTDGWYLRRYHLSGGSYQRIRFYCPTEMFDLEDEAVVVFRKGFPIDYEMSDGVTRIIRLDKDYGFRYTASDQTFTYDATLTYEDTQMPDIAFSFTEAENANTFPESSVYKQNFPISMTPAVSVTDETYISLLDSADSAAYIDLLGCTSEELTQAGVKAYFILTSGFQGIQITWGSDLTWIEEGSVLSFKKGMSVSCKADGAIRKLRLADDVNYVVTKADMTNHKLTLTNYAEEGAWALLESEFGTGKTTGVDDSQGIKLLDPATGKNNLLDEITTTLYYDIPDETVTEYIDFAGWSLDQQKESDVRFKVVKDGEHQLFQFFFGNSAEKLELGSMITLKKGMPFYYTTAAAKKRAMYLDKDYVWQVTTGNDENTKVLAYMSTEDNKTWGMNTGIYNVASGNSEGYYNNIFLQGDIVSDETKQMYHMTEDAVLTSYLQFGNIDPSRYAQLGIGAQIVLNGDTKVLQLRWGQATDLIEEGQKVVFKKGFPIAIDTDGSHVLYKLDANYTFTIKKHADGKNGYRLVGATDSSDIMTGDMDGDYLRNKNDIVLLRMQLVGAILDRTVADTDENEGIDSRDLVRAKKEWDQAEQESYEILYTDTAPERAMEAGAATEIALNQNIGTKNYIRLTYKSDKNLVGQFIYSDGNKEYTEDFYLESDNVQFKQFFDNYRTNGINAKSKILKKIILTNVGNSTAKVRINRIEISERDMEDDDMLYLDNGNIKIGVDLNMGGALGYLASLAYNPAEYTNSSKEVLIKTGSASSGETKRSTGEVNLLNIYDLGRQVQQSYYIDVQDSDYTRGSYNGNSAWPYNPVQAGDNSNNESQIVDYRKVDADGQTLIYIKVRAMDWAQNNRTTKSYMENWYRLNKNMVQVDNAFVNWEGFTDPGQAKPQELPAVYLGQSLNYFVQGRDTANRKTYGPWTGDSGFKTSGTDTLSDWYAWVNDKTAADAFGVGIYIPGVTGCTAGRCQESNSYVFKYDIFDKKWNQNAEEAPILSKTSYMKDSLYQHEYQNCFVYNTSYIAPGVTTTLKEYQSYEYTYVLSVDTLDKMESSFNGLKSTITNDQIANLWY